MRPGLSRGKRHLTAALALASASLSLHAAGDVLSSKRGFGGGGGAYNLLQATGAGWYYTWGTNPGAPGNFDANFYPMFWSAPSQTTINSVKARNPQYVLGFNEPERTDQANMSVGSAISSWTAISNTFAGSSTRLVSPAVADTGGTTGGQAWLSDFMTRATAAKLKVDAIAFHWYAVNNPNNPAGAASSFLGRVDSYHNKYGLPVFISEFAIHDWAGAYTDAQIIDANRQFLDIVIPGLESRSYVAGYSWYTWFSDAHLYSGSPPAPTPMAYSYVGALKNGQVENIGGRTLGEHAAYLDGGELTMTGSAGTVHYISALAASSRISGTLDWGLSGAGDWVRIASGATLNKTGSNKITFGAGAVTNDGTLTLTQGVLQLGVPVTGSGTMTLPSDGGAVGSTARLELTDNISVSSSITFAQRSGPSDGIRNVRGVNTLSGRITISPGGAAARIQSDSGQLTLSGGITTNAGSGRNLYLQGAGAGVVSGIISNNASNAAGAINVFKEGAGYWNFSAANTYSGVTTVNAGTLSVTGSIAASSGVTVNTGGTFEAAASQKVKSLTLGDGALARVSTGAAAKVLTLGDNSTASPLNITGTGRLDLSNNALVVDSAPGSAAATFAAVHGQILSGFAGGAWSGGGITSSTAAANPSSNGIGYASASDILGPTGGTFLGATVDPDAVLARYTLLGDATLDGVVDFNDLVKLAQNYNIADGTRLWNTGDFTYDGNVDFNDLVKLAQNYNSPLPSEPISGATASFTQDLAAAFAQVPEPGTFSLLGIFGAATLGRRKRHA
jgi:autotransporter-associated beta strand protein